jgi:hypothetical protein
MPYTVQKYLCESKSDYVINHDSYTSAIQAMKSFVKKQGYTLDEDELTQEVGLGPGKPKPGKTNKFHLSLYKNGTQHKKSVHFQVYNRETNSNTYELNMYIS